MLRRISRLLFSAVILVLLLPTFSIPSAAQKLRLEFAVDINQKWLGTTHYDPDISLSYWVTIDTSLFGSYTGTAPDGRDWAYTYFSDAIFPTTQFTSEVLSSINQPLNPYTTSVGIYREFSEYGYGSGQPETFQAIYLTTDASSYPPAPDNTWTSYQRGLQRQQPIGSGNLVTTFDEQTFRAYMESLIGDSAFYFSDSYIVSQHDPNTNSSMTISQIGYTGNATLVAVHPISEAVQAVTIDIKPGNDTNSINICSGGGVPVAILGSAEFDATTVDAGSLRFAGAAVNQVGGKNEKAQCSFKDVNEDGFVDLVCHFKITDFVEPVDGTLKGALLDGRLIEGSDTVNVFPESCPSPFGPLLQ